MWYKNWILKVDQINFNTNFLVVGRASDGREGTLEKLVDQQRIKLAKNTFNFVISFFLSGLKFIRSTCDFRQVISTNLEEVRQVFRVTR